MLDVDPTTSPPKTPQGDGACRYNLVMDLDNCMYKKSSGLGDQMMEQILTFGTDTLGLTREQANEDAEWGYHTYGLAVVGYVKRHDLKDIRGYLTHIHNLDHEGLIEKNPALVERVRACRQGGCRVWIFTNGIDTHARACLSALGFRADEFDNRLVTCYEQWGVESTTPMPPPQTWENKPHASAYKQALRYMEAQVPGCLKLPIVFADDTPHNLGVPKQLGWTTVLVSEKVALPEDGIFVESPAECEHAAWGVKTIVRLFDVPPLAACWAMVK